jgi:hypothetical protein
MDLAWRDAIERWIARLWTGVVKASKDVCWEFDLRLEDVMQRVSGRWCDLTSRSAGDAVPPFLILLVRSGPAFGICFIKPFK